MSKLIGLYLSYHKNVIYLPDTYKTLGFTPEVCVRSFDVKSLRRVFLRKYRLNPTALFNSGFDVFVFWCNDLYRTVHTTKNHIVTLSLSPPRVLWYFNAFGSEYAATTMVMHENLAQVRFLLKWFFLNSSSHCAV